MACADGGGVVHDPNEVPLYAPHLALMTMLPGTRGCHPRVVTHPAGMPEAAPQAPVNKNSYHTLLLPTAEYPVWLFST